MAKNTKQVALIQHRRGLKSELPKQLNEAELALTLDTNEVFIGNPNNPVLLERVKADEAKYPYGNIQILTEYSDNMNMIDYSFKTDGNTVKYPVIAIGTEQNPEIASGSSLYINGTEILFNGDDDTIGLDSIIRIINESNINVKASNNNNYLMLITTDSAINLENGTIVDGRDTPLKSLGLVEGYTSQSPNDRHLQDVLDDRTSIKNFDVKGDNLTNDGPKINNAIISLYGGNNEVKKAKELFFPAGEYIIEDTSLMLITNTHLKGEGIGRTILKSTPSSGIKPIMITADDNYIIATGDNYCNGLTLLHSSKYPHNILVEDMTIDGTDGSISNLIVLGSSYFVTFKNVEFNGNSTCTLAELINNSNISHIKFINCIFKAKTNSNFKCENGIVINGNVYNMLVEGCLFSHFNTEAIKFITSDEDISQTNCIISHNYFEDCADVSDTALDFGNKTSFLTVTDNAFHNKIYEMEGKRPYKQDISVESLNYIDIRNIDEDERKILKYRFNQPQWSYIDYLVNPDGEYLIKTEYDTDLAGNINPLTNSLVLNQGDLSNNNTFSINGKEPEGNVALNSGKYGNIIIGESFSKYDTWEDEKEYNVNDIVEYQYKQNKTLYKCIKNHTSSAFNSPDIDKSIWELYKDRDDESIIKLGKKLELNDNHISNNIADSDIVFETKSNIIKVEDNNETRPYEYRIAPINSALTNVAYVNRVANPYIRSRLDFNNLDTIGKSKIELIYFDPALYGDFIYLQKASFNVRRPFYPMYDNIDINNAIQWKENYKWYAGEIVKYTDVNGTETNTSFYACTQDHISTNDFYDDSNDKHLWTEVYKEFSNFENEAIIETLKDVKYVSLYAYNGVDADRLLFKVDMIDLQRRDINGNYYNEVVYGKIYQKDEIALYNNRYWKSMKDNNTLVNVYDLHDTTKWTLVQESGFNYIFDFERNIFIEERGVMVEDKDYILEYNFSNYHLELRLYDEDGKLLPEVKSDYTAPDYIDWESNTHYEALVDGMETILFYNNEYYKVLEDYTSGDEFSIYNSDGKEVLTPYEIIPTPHIQISPAGALLVNIDYMRGTN